MKKRKACRKAREWYAVERTDINHECIVAFNERRGAEGYKRVCENVPWARTSEIFKVRKVLRTKKEGRR